MEENNRTNKEVLTKGLKQLLLCLIFMFLGPAILHLAFSNQNKPLYIALLILAILLCILAIGLLVVGINTIMNSMFNNKK
ncbi:DUF6095 family protein [Winogradskyella litoriviva]|uniref:DUF6095 family protein n=1 Tax=Winogradskyella litoriviva TaxID=1220182 RepID=UPI001F50D54B|nr:DUF6095 family protein [Winogradskyella litoriviva]